MYVCVCSSWKYKRSFIVSLRFYDFLGASNQRGRDWMPCLILALEKQQPPCVSTQQDKCTQKKIFHIHDPITVIGIHCNQSELYCTSELSEFRSLMAVPVHVMSDFYAYVIRIIMNTITYTKQTNFILLENGMKNWIENMGHSEWREQNLKKK